MFVRSGRVCEQIRTLLDGHRLTGQARLVDLQLATMEQPQVSGHFVARLQENDVAGDEDAGSHALRLPGSHDRRLAVERLGKGQNGLDGARFLEEADEGVREHDTEDHRGVDPLLQRGRDEGGSEQDVDEGLMELKEKTDERALRLPLRKAIRSETLLAMFEFEGVETVVGVRLEKLEDFAESEMMPVLSEDGFHRRSPVGRVVVEAPRRRWPHSPLAEGEE
jgi:hypothetical protein